jgi:hypothetical protein
LDYVAERLGFGTQKTEALLERILKENSSEADLVLDPFRNCGTKLQVAQLLNRWWKHTHRNYCDRITPCYRRLL